jgi:hypothetical protein
MCDAGANGFMHKRPFGVCLLQSATLALVQSSMHLDRCQAILRNWRPT